MLNGLFTATSAMDAFQTSVETTANNLANSNTTAFKRSIVDFQDLIYSGPTNLQLGHGVKVADISTRDFKQGAEESTGAELDLFISGGGFFAVQHADGTTKYTRDGSFQRDALGQLVTAQGDIVQPPIVFPADTVSTNISIDGVVSVVTGSGEVKTLGQLQLTSFPNPAGLQQEANNLYSETPASGTPTTGIPGTSNLGSVRQRSLEQSNVDLTTEMTSLVTAQRAYDANSRVVKTADQIISSALDIVR
ncbi:MAG: flagellar hook-basal body complex protein [Planctomycetes bacterium]|nr:flagellar hook-basal body complex protein [Planctomycetota bacterium]